MSVFRTRPSVAGDGGSGHFEAAGDYTSRLALMEELKMMPVGAVWNYHCLESGTIAGEAWLGEVKQYERDVLAARK